MSVTSYKVGGANLSDICNTENQSYYGDITTNYNQNGSDVGTILSLNTFTTDAIITPCKYTAEINQYNTGAVWNGPAIIAGTPLLSFSSVSMSTNGVNALACASPFGFVYYSSNSGQNWTKSPSTETPNWNCVSLSSGVNALACADSNVSVGTSYIYWSNDSGQSWTKVAPVTGSWTSISISSNGQYGVACAANYYIYWSNDSGHTWTQSSSGTPNWKSVSISSSGQYALACAANDYIYWSNDYGHTWILSLAGSWKSISISSSGQYAIVCNYGVGYIYWSDTYGQTWNISNSGQFEWYSVSISSTGQYAVACVNPTTYANTKQIYHSNDYGETWNTSNSPVLTKWTGVSISGNGQYAIACNDYTEDQIVYSSNTSTTYVNKDLTAVFEPLYKYNTWALAPNQPSISTAYWRGISASSTGQYVIACTNGSVNDLYYSTDKGVSWTLGLNGSTSPSSGDFWNDVSISSSGQYMVACSVLNAGAIWYSNNFGILGSWFTASNSSGEWGSISISGNGLYVIAGIYNGGHISYSSNSGVSFTVSSSSAIANWSSMSLSSNGDYAIACSSGGSGQIYYSTDKGVSWTASYFSTGGLATGNWDSVSISSSGQYAVAASSSQIYYSNGGGTFWTQAYSVTPALASGAAWTDIAISYTGQYAVACTYAGQIYYSSDYGNKWVVATGSPTGNWWAITISGNGQYAFGTDDLGGQKIYKCLATN
jgi:hypothetical protein